MLWGLHANQEQAQEVNNNPVPMEPNPQHNAQEQEQNPVGEGEELPPQGMEPSVEFSNRNEVKILLFQEMWSKKYIFSCPTIMYKCSMHIRPPQDPTVGKHAVILVPSMRRIYPLHSFFFQKYWHVVENSVRTLCRKVFDKHSIPQTLIPLSCV